MLKSTHPSAKSSFNFFSPILFGIDNLGRDRALVLVATRSNSTRLSNLVPATSI